MGHWEEYKLLILEAGGAKVRLLRPMETHIDDEEIQPAEAHRAMRRLVAACCVSLNSDVCPRV
jgi:hypothetical protein